MNVLLSCSFDLLCVNIQLYLVPLLILLDMRFTLSLRFVTRVVYIPDLILRCSFTTHEAPLSLYAIVRYLLHDRWMVAHKRELNIIHGMHRTIWHLSRYAISQIFMAGDVVLQNI